MSKDWTIEELKAASQAMKEAGHLSFEEFCEKLNEATEKEEDHGKEQLR